LAFFIYGRKMKKFKHILWDWNGTLFDDVVLCSDIMNNILKRRGMGKITLEKYKNVFDFPVRNYYEAVGFTNLTDELFHELSVEFIQEYESRKLTFGLSEGAVEILEKINNQGIEQSVLSAYSQKTLEEIVKHFRISKYFIGLAGLDNIYAASKVENGKNWMKKLKLSRGEALMVGDTLHDKEVADEIGAESVLLSTGHQSKERLLQSGVPVIDSLFELEEFIY
jgi:phosphoglycolate phosphatase